MVDRVYNKIVTRHLQRWRQMAFISGPRQVGKTTLARQQADSYIDWDNADDQRRILAGPAAVAAHAQINELSTQPRIIAFDEIHKYRSWKNWLKGFFDTYTESCRVVVTGSSRLDVFRRGGDSMMGRYFHYRMHPLSVGELIAPDPLDHLVRPPKEPPEGAWNTLWEHGGFPEPWIHHDSAFSRRWRDSRLQQLIRVDLRELTAVEELARIALLVELLQDRSGDQLTMSSCADTLKVSPPTVKRWLDILVSLHVGFLVRPWFANVEKSLRKEPKWYLRDWSGIGDPGHRAETFIACHLLKAVDMWSDLGLGAFELRYLRDKTKREVDFLVVREKKPWFLVEVKTGRDQLSPALAHFQNQIRAPHAFQAVMELDYVDADCFDKRKPIVVPARTLLSQLP